MPPRSRATVATPAKKPPAERILAAAEELFFTQGFKGTSVRDITAASGLTPAALYNHFPSKEEVLFTLVSRATDEGERMLNDAVAAAAADPESQLRALAYASALFHARHRASAMIATFEYVHLPEAQRAVIVERRRGLRTRLERTLEHGVRSGVFELPAMRGDATKLTATAIVNLVLRATEFFGPFPAVKDEELAGLHADLACRMVLAR
ncbi:TetR/AcrR family transcriptional regulator [Nonomuraea sp. NPDC059023]|uniref:TetR/AcrR family transcriptional regulator n=1 Tax=unclassified Nonomuraea TaxID=2593643 RepID=UPI0036CE803B